MPTTGYEKYHFIETAQALLEHQNPDEILAKLASVLVQHGGFPQVTLSLFDRPHPPELATTATPARRVSLALDQPTGRQNGKQKRQRQQEKIELQFEFKESVLGLAHLYLAEGHILSQVEVDYFQSLVNVASLAVHQAKQRQQLEELSIKDDLTGCYNRRYFFESLKRELSWAERYGRVFSLLLLDLDELKSINDIHGHLAGDTVLRTLGELLRENVRTSDLVCRYGGDEFVVLLPETNKAQAHLLSQRLLKKIDRQSLRVGRRRIKLGACCGISAYPEDNNLIEVADQDCYLAKARKKASPRNKSAAELAEKSA